MEVIGRRKTKRRLAITFLTFASLVGLTASQAIAQDGERAFSQEIPEQTITFTTVNPYTKVAGSMTITFSGVFRATRLTELTGSGTSHITGGQRGTFAFVPDDPSQPTISGKFRFTLIGKTQPQTDTIKFAFRMDGMALDGSAVSFLQTERAVVNEGSLDISFGSTELFVPAKDNRPVASQ